MAWPYTGAKERRIADGAQGFTLIGCLSILMPTKQFGSPGANTVGQDRKLTRFGLDDQESVWIEIDDIPLDMDEDSGGGISGALPCPRASQAGHKRGQSTVYMC
jgi:hypothetical protein